jgi:hypothetical protein
MVVYILNPRPGCRGVRLRQDCELKASLGCIARSYFHKRRKKEKRM